MPRLLFAFEHVTFFLQFFWTVVRFGDKHPIGSPKPRLFSSKTADKQNLTSQTCNNNLAAALLMPVSLLRPMGTKLNNCRCPFLSILYILLGGLATAILQRGGQLIPLEKDGDCVFVTFAEGVSLVMHV